MPLQYKNHEQVMYFATTNCCLDYVFQVPVYITSVELVYFTGIVSDCKLVVGQLVKLVKPKLNHTPFLLHMVEDDCLTGGYWLHETLQEHHYQGNGGVS